MGLKDRKVISINNYRNKKEENKANRNCSGKAERASPSAQVYALENFVKAENSFSSLKNKEEFLRSAFTKLDKQFQMIPFPQLCEILAELGKAFNEQDLCDWLLCQGKLMLDLDLLTEARRYFILVWALFKKLGQPGDAQKSFLQIVAEIAVKSGHNSEAVYCFKQILTIQPGDKYVCKRLADIYQKMMGENLAQRWNKRAD
ncbi:hypothetical protein ACFL35_07175 [Candidatus Riflebacteria bacterium]